jgi:outer membrane biosynthesis protein TonB
MRKAPVFLLAISLAALLAGCAGQTVPLGGAQIGALSATAATTATVTDEKRDVPVSADTSDVENPAGPAENVKPQENAQQPESKADASESPVPAGEEQPDVPEQPTTPEQPVMPAPAPTPAEEQEQTVPEVTPEPAPKPAASGNIYSIAEAIQAGNEYARAQYGVTIDTSMTAADSSFFPGTADSVAWLAENGGQAALTAAVKGNVDATFACLAAMDGAETVSAYARFNCTARYDAASDEYIVVVMYG